MKPKSIYIASDHAGFELKKQIVAWLEQHKCTVKDIGPKSDKRVDYPDFADQVCQPLREKEKAVGVLICGSGQGMAMRANKHPHVRAAICWDIESALLAKQHNDANVLCVGSRLIHEDIVFQILEIFLTERFEGGRHQQRVDKISKPVD